MRGDQLLNLLLRLALQANESDHHVGHLHAGVVDVVLHVDGVPGGAQQANKSVAQNGVAQMPDVRRLVGIDAGVLDQNLAANVGSAFAVSGRLSVAVSRSQQFAAPQRRASGCALMYPAPATSSFSNPSGSGNLRDNLLGNFARRLAQLLRQLERKRQRKLAQFDLGRLLDDDVRQFELILVAEKLANAARPGAFVFRGTR